MHRTLHVYDDLKFDLIWIDDDERPEDAFIAAEQMLSMLIEAHGKQKLLDDTDVYDCGYCVRNVWYFSSCLTNKDGKIELKISRDEEAQKKAGEEYQREASEIRATKFGTIVMEIYASKVQTAKERLKVTGGNTFDLNFEEIFQEAAAKAGVEFSGAELDALCVAFREKLEMAQNEKLILQSVKKHDN
jgi:hypothetical protein